MKLRVGTDGKPGVMLFENEQPYDRLTSKQARILAASLLHEALVNDDRAESLNFDRPDNYYTT